MRVEICWWWLENERLPSLGQLAPLAPPQQKQVHTKLPQPPPLGVCTSLGLALVEPVTISSTPSSHLRFPRASGMAFHRFAHVNPTDEQAAALTDGPELNNQALRLEKQGDLAGAELKHLEALRVKEAGLGTDHITTAVSYNGLGELYLQMGQLDKAEEYLNKALRVRERKGPASDLATTRDDLGRFFEMKGDLQAAHEVRMKGAPDNIACSNFSVSPCISITPSRYPDAHPHSRLQCSKLQNSLSNLYRCSACKVSSHS